jgi:RNA polymerase sigma-70 factor (ECF subfamily)
VAEQGKRREFEDEALVHMDALYRVALRLAKNRHEAEDLVQETYLKAYRHFHQFERGTNCRAWLFKILRNNFLNSVKRLGRELLEHSDRGRNDPRPAAGEDVESSSFMDHPEQEFFERLIDREVEQALENLPSVFREVVVLVDLEECSYKEAAQICDLPIGTVMSRLSRGRLLLRQALLGYARERGIVRSEEE